MASALLDAQAVFLARAYRRLDFEVRMLGDPRRKYHGLDELLIQALVHEEEPQKFLEWLVGVYNTTNLLSQSELQLTNDRRILGAALSTKANCHGHSAKAKAQALQSDRNMIDLCRKHASALDPPVPLDTLIPVCAEALGFLLLPAPSTTGAPPPCTGSRGARVHEAALVVTPAGSARSRSRTHRAQRRAP